MADNCAICGWAKDDAKKIYEDDSFVAILTPTPASIGHVLLFTKDHLPILEQVPDYLAGQMFVVANKISTAIFESISVQGTNIILQNGIPAGQKAAHVALHIIPRVQGDGMDFNWTPKQLTEEEMSTIELQVKENTKDIGGFELSAPSKSAPVEKQPEAKFFSEDDAEENYMIKHLRRIP